MWEESMSILADLLLEALGSVLVAEPSSDRAIVVTFSAGSCGLLIAAIWFLMTADPARQFARGHATLVGSLLCGAGGLLVSVLHLRRVPSDHLPALACLAVNLGAVMSLEMKRTAAPFFRSDVGDRLGEVPAVAAKVLSIVLALAVGMVFRLGQDDGSVLPRALTVTVGILDPNLNDM
jgi:hypothetical protein